MHPGFSRLPKWLGNGFGFDSPTSSHRPSQAFLQSLGSIGITPGRLGSIRAARSRRRGLRSILGSVIGATSPLTQYLPETLEHSNYETKTKITKFDANFHGNTVQMVSLLVPPVLPFGPPNGLPGEKNRYRLLPVISHFSTVSMRVFSKSCRDFPTNAVSFQTCRLSFAMRRSGVRIPIPPPLKRSPGIRD
jgi:hypothetical protein